MLLFGDLKINSLVFLLVGPILCESNTFPDDVLAVDTKFLLFVLTLSLGTPKAGRKVGPPP